MQTRMWKIVSLVMATLFPLSMMAESGAMATPSGNVNLNGAALSRPAAVLAGDRIDTRDGTLSMTMAGSSVQVTPKSSVVFAPDQLQIESGGVRIATSSRLGSHIRNLSVRPTTEAKSVYTLGERQGKILIAALEGPLTVSDAHGRILIAANHAVAIPVQEPTDQPTCKPGDKKCEKAMKSCKGDKACEASAASASAAGGAAAGGTAAGASAAGGAAAAGASVSTAAAIGIAAAAAAISAGASYGIAVANTPKASPSAP